MNLCINCQFYYRPLWHVIVFGRLAHKCKADWGKKVCSVTGKIEVRSEWCEIRNGDGNCQKYEDEK